MLLVVDANVVISSLINKGTTFQVFKHNARTKQCHFIAPAFLLSEVNMEKVIQLSNLSKQNIDTILSLITEQIQFISFSTFSKHFSQAMEINFKDSAYLALAMRYDCAIFSGDKGLKKQDIVTVYSPRELLDLLHMNKK